METAVQDQNMHKTNGKTAVTRAEQAGKGSATGRMYVSLLGVVRKEDSAGSK
jgi:hypothetical protein